MVVRLSKYLELHEIIYPNQFGFRSGYSTTNSLIGITENLKQLWTKKQFVHLNGANSETTTVKGPYTIRYSEAIFTDPIKFEHCIYCSLWCTLGFGVGPTVFYALY